MKMVEISAEELDNDGAMVIITHTDPDGWFSEYVVRKYLDIHNPSCAIASFNWDYSDTTEIEDFVKKNKDNISDIYMTDVTLPDDFMRQYAPLITHIDHHVSAISKPKDWQKNLKNNYSSVTVKGYPGSNNKQADQISACELTWLSLFPNDDMPDAIRYIGRYDVWDHDKHNLTIDFMNYIVNTCANEGNYLPLSDKIDYIMDNKNTNAILDFGKNITKFKEILDKARALEYVNIVNIYNKVVAIINHTAKGSQFFQAIVEKDDVDILMYYYFSMKDDCWKVSAYSVEGNPISALKFIQNFRNDVTGIISMGGHDRACGFSIKPERITSFLNVIRGQ